MGARIGFLTLSLALFAGAAAAQQSPAVPDMSSIYCSGAFTAQAVAKDTYLISGEQSVTSLTFTQGDLVYINKGSSQGVKVGDEFQVIRAEKDEAVQIWFKWQTQLMNAMGTMYADLGRLRVVHVDAKTATAEIIFACDYMQRGDIVMPAIERPAPPLKSNTKFDRFAPSSGKSAMVVTTKSFGQSAGASTIVYVNLGSAQGVKVGDYFRVFRYQGSTSQVAPVLYGYAYKIYGFGSTPVRYEWGDIPREILGEGIVLRVSPNSSTVMITLSLREIYLGDYVEIEP
jgi:hypothetical protein